MQCTHMLSNLCLAPSDMGVISIHLFIKCGQICKYLKPKIGLTLTEKRSFSKLRDLPKLAEKSKNIYWGLKSPQNKSFFVLERALTKWEPSGLHGVSCRPLPVRDGLWGERGVIDDCQVSGGGKLT